MKLDAPFLQLPLHFDAQRLADEVLALPESAWRPHPNALPGNHALPLLSPHGNPDSDGLLGPMRPTAHMEKCPYLRQVLTAIGGVWGRSRLMRLSAQAEVSAHVDTKGGARAPGPSDQ